MVTGYKGTGPIRLAFDSGEVDGVCNAWESFKSTWRKQLDSGDVVIVLQGTVKAHPELPNIPVAFDFLKTEEARKLFQVVVRVGAFDPPLFSPAGHTQRAGADPAQGLHGYHEGPRVLG